MTVLVITEQPAPEPEVIRCTCGSLQVKVRTSMPGQEACISYLQCQACQRTWKVRGATARVLILLEAT